MSARSASQGASGGYLVFTAFVSGAVIMIVELIGSRVIGPSFGVSLFVWTSIITVTLVSLALGYWLGGRLADARHTSDALFLIILAAGLYLLAVPSCKNFVLKTAISMGLRGGTLFSAAALFAPPLFLLGMVAPYIVKLLLTSEGGVGSTVGRLYAVSTAGSFLGTISTGFVLIPNVGVSNIIYLSSLALIALSACYWAAFRRKRAVLILIALPLCLMAVPTTLPAVTRPDGTLVELVKSEDSAYGQIKVVDYSYGETRYREFLLDNIIQGAMDVNTGLSIFLYQYSLEQLVAAYAPDARRALVIGLGAGIVPPRLEKVLGISTDAVEIDPAVLKTAEELFFFKPGRGSVTIGDGRYFLASSDSLYDAIILDAFSGDITPSHLMGVEAFVAMRRRLSPDGVLLINFLGSVDDNGPTGDVYATLLKTFTFVDVYAPTGMTSPGKPTNIIFVAYGKEKAPDKNARLSAPVHLPLAGDVNALFNRDISLAGNGDALTDDFNPLDFKDRLLRERFRSATIKSSDVDIVVH
jgi:spermidine synthase